MHWNWRLKKKWSIFYHRRFQVPPGWTATAFLGLQGMLEQMLVLQVWVWDCSQCTMGWDICYPPCLNSKLESVIAWSFLQVYHWFIIWIQHWFTASQKPWIHCASNIWVQQTSQIPFCIASNHSSCSNACLEWVFLYWNWWWIIGFQVHLSYGKLRH